MKGIWHNPGRNVRAFVCPAAAFYFPYFQQTHCKVQQAVSAKRPKKGEKGETKRSKEKEEEANERSATESVDS